MLSKVDHVLSGRYRIVRPLSAGGMGSVFEGLDLATNDRVAIKRLHEHLVRDPVVVERFLREARTTAELRHPNIVAVRDHGYDPTDGTPFLVMEYLVGRDLRGVLRDETALSPLRVVQIGLQVLSALDAAHRAGVVHRDIKPANVFVCSAASGGDVVKVLDFGVAKLLDATNGPLTSTGQVIGTLQYMAPEQALGQHVDARADIFAVGAVLYHLLSGQRAFTGDGAALAHSHSPRSPLPLRAASPGIDERLAAIVERAMQRDPRDRFPTAEAMAEALAAFRPMPSHSLRAHVRDQPTFADSPRARSESANAPDQGAGGRAGDGAGDGAGARDGVRDRAAPPPGAPNAQNAQSAQKPQRARTARVLSMVALGGVALAGGLLTFGVAVFGGFWPGTRTATAGAGLGPAASSSAAPDAPSTAQAAGSGAALQPTEPTDTTQPVQPTKGGAIVVVGAPGGPGSSATGATSTAATAPAAGTEAPQGGGARGGANAGGTPGAGTGGPVPPDGQGSTPPSGAGGQSGAPGPGETNVGHGTPTPTPTPTLTPTPNAPATAAPGPPRTLAFAANPQAKTFEPSAVEALLASKRDALGACYATSDFTEATDARICFWIKFGAHGVVTRALAAGPATRSIAECVSRTLAGAKLHEPNIMNANNATDFCITAH